MSAAALKVLDISELLEEILLHLPLRQLLLMQQVNKRFHAHINDSPNIRNALFLGPSTEDVEWHPRWGHKDAPRRERGHLTPLVAHLSALQHATEFCFQKVFRHTSAGCLATSMTLSARVHGLELE
ncbi:hypothetical protein LTR37_015402 [Vermiconidia calcicola]|uniref:Uncharacterized protein n=1 Tax=Vermiconidia calcicola TaxID=1690605 RepID=A0ACC3MQR7_9PEZI|nr:hypothetical protein LTR37_015402 [Vermiconidia calcicola]